MTANTHKYSIEFYNNNNSKYAIKTNTQILRLAKDKDNIKIFFPTKKMSSTSNLIPLKKIYL